jgi:hypothetical protein
MSNLIVLPVHRLGVSSKVLMIPPPPAPPTREECASIGRVMAATEWARLPEALRRRARFDPRAKDDGLRLLVDFAGVQAVGWVASEDCLDRAKVGAALLDVVRLAGL